MSQVQMVLTDGYCGLKVGLPPSACSPLLLKTTARDRATQLSPTLQPLLARPNPLMHHYKVNGFLPSRRHAAKLTKSNVDLMQAKINIV